MILRVLLALGAAAVAVWFISARLQYLIPPDHIRFAAGRPGGAYYGMAEQYRTILARDGITLEIIDTAGSVENIALMSAPDPEERPGAAFVQGGVPVPEDSDLEALAATFLEPLWVFYNNDVIDRFDFSGLDTLRVAVGEEGSGTRFAVMAILDGLSEPLEARRIVGIGGQDAVDALQSNTVDAAMFVAPTSAPYLQTLIHDPRFSLASIRDSEAVARNLSFVARTDIPRSGFNYAAELPRQTVDLVAMVGRIVVQPDLHPALIDRLINAARIVHSDRDLITDANRFPTSDVPDMPVNAQAVNQLSGPPSPLYRFLPYWIAAQINSFALLIVPALVILLPMLRLLPSLYRWRMRSRVYRHYPEILDIERTLQVASDTQTLDGLEQKLGTLEADMLHLRLPVTYREYAYTMRLHIQLVRDRLAAKRLELTRGGG